ncbi:hypothetical protein ACJZ2D_004513 [Fusarium nematophilum]
MSQDVGAMPPPDGVTPDFDGGTSLQRSVLVAYSCTFAIASITLALRLYCASAIVPLILLAWGSSLAFFIGVVLEGNRLPSGQLLLVLGLTYLWPPTLAKLAILVLYHRLIPNMGFRLALYAVAAGLVVYTLVLTILLAGPCNPQKPGTNTCVVNLTVSQAVLNIVSDAIVIVLPIPLVHRLKMPLKQRITVGLLLALGSAVVIVSCIRFGYVRKMEKNPDITWTQASAALWSCIEMNTAIVCNCLAQLKPFARRHIPWLAKFVSGASQPKPYPDEASTSHSSKRWRGDNASHRYELHSVGRTEQPVGAASGCVIVVVDEYQVQFAPSRNTIGDAASTEAILHLHLPPLLSSSFFTGKENIGRDLIAITHPTIDIPLPSPSSTLACPHLSTARFPCYQSRLIVEDQSVIITMEEDWSVPELTPSPNVEPSSAVDWVDVADPALVSVEGAAIMAQNRFIAAQNQLILRHIENIYSILSKTQSRRSSTSSAAASTVGDDLPALESEIDAAYAAVSSGDLFKIIADIHDYYLDDNQKKLHVTRTLASNKDSQTFKDHLIEVLTDDMNDEQGDQAAILSHLENLTPDLITDIYIKLNKEKKIREKPQDSEDSEDHGNGE